MGLDTTHDAWGGSYSGFNTWRKWLAKQIGITLSEMDGHTGAESNYVGISWDSLPPDDLHILLNHSDCDGEISWEDCGKVAKRLNELIKAIEVTEENEWMVDAMDRFSKGCQLAYDSEETLGFH